MLWKLEVWVLCWVLEPSEKHGVCLLCWICACSGCRDAAFSSHVRCAVPPCICAYKVEYMSDEITERVNCSCVGIVEWTASSPLAVCCSGLSRYSRRAPRSSINCQSQYR